MMKRLKIVSQKPELDEDVPQIVKTPEKTLNQILQNRERTSLDSNFDVDIMLRRRSSQMQTSQNSEFQELLQNVDNNSTDYVNMRSSGMDLKFD